MILHSLTTACKNERREYSSTILCTFIDFPSELPPAFSVAVYHLCCFWVTIINDALAIDSFEKVFHIQIAFVEEQQSWRLKNRLQKSGKRTKIVRWQLETVVSFFQLPLTLRCVICPSWLLCFCCTLTKLDENFLCYFLSPGNKNWYMNRKSFIFIFMWYNVNGLGHHGLVQDEILICLYWAKSLKHLSCSLF